MHARKSCDELINLASAPANLDTLCKAVLLIEGLEQSNSEVEPPQDPNGTVREKLSSAQNWFEILCGVGEDGDWQAENVRSSIMADLLTIRDNTGANADDVNGAYFRSWPLTPEE